MRRKRDMGRHSPSRFGDVVLAAACLSLGGAWRPCEGVSEGSFLRWCKPIIEPEVLKLAGDFANLSALGAETSGQFSKANVEGFSVLEGTAAANVLLLPPLRTPYFSLSARLRGRAQLFIAEELARWNKGYALSFAPDTGEGFTAHLAGLYDGQEVYRIGPEARMFWLQGGWTYSPHLYNVYSLKPPVSQNLPAALKPRFESEVAKVVPFSKRWTCLQLERSPEGLRMLVDGRVIREARFPQEVGTRPGVFLGQSALLKTLVVWELPSTESGFYPIDLSSHVNARACGSGADLGDGAALSQGSLPPEGLYNIKGVVMRLSRCDGLDSVDVGTSFWPWGRKYMTAESQTFSSALQCDPWRIVLSVPRRFYREMKLLCFSDTDPAEVPILTVRMFEPPWGYHVDSEVTVPTWHGNPATGVRAEELDAGPMQGKGAGQRGKLWLVTVPLDPCKAQDYVADPGQPALQIELAKQVRLLRGYPDPYLYDCVPVGPQSAVHILAATLIRSPVEMVLEPGERCWMYEEPTVPSFRLTVDNYLAPRHKAKLTVHAQDFYGATTEAKYTLDIAGSAIGNRRSQTANPKSQRRAVHVIQLPVPKRGHYSLTATLEGPRYRLERKTSFVVLAPDTRRATGWESPFGVWVAHHRGAPAEDQVAFYRKMGFRWLAPHPDTWWCSDLLLNKAKLTPGYHRGVFHSWPEKEEDLEKFLEEDRKGIRDAPKATVYNVMWEWYFSGDYGFGLPPVFLGKQPEKVLDWFDDAERQKFSRTFELFKRYAEMMRKEFPGKKISLGNAAYSVLLPFLEAGFPASGIDFLGLDIPYFERMPERPPAMVELNQMYFLKVFQKKFGYDKIPLAGTEHMYYPDIPGSLTEEEAACYFVRSHVLSMAAYNMQYFFSAGCVAKAGNDYGRQHYGGTGYLHRAPELNPTVAAAAMAVLTRVLDAPRHETWATHPTGSFSICAVSVLRRYREGRCLILWTLRGERPARVLLRKDTRTLVTDMMGNEERLQALDGAITLTVKPEPTCVELPEVTAPEDISIEVGEPSYTKKPAEGSKVIEAFQGSFDWEPSNEERKSYEENQVTLPRFRGDLAFEHADLTGRPGKGLRCTLKQEQKYDPKLAPLYTILRHTKGGIELPGAPTEMGFWCRGNSSWARVIPVLRDAKGERWTMIGNLLKGSYKVQAEQDEITAKGGEGWNSDDIHSWSSVYHDGWRYMEMELPSTFPGDQARGPGQVWWKNEGGDEIVDLPLKLEEFIVEMRSHVVYVGELTRIRGENSIEVDDVTVSYRGGSRFAGSG